MVRTLPTLSIRAGQFQCDQLHGTGIEWDAVDKRIACGQWTNSTLAESRVAVLTNGTHDLLSKCTRLPDTVRYANVFYTDGSTFKGELTREGQRAGHGRMMIKRARWWQPLFQFKPHHITAAQVATSIMDINHAIFDGEWSDDKPNGHGTAILPDKREYIGKWKNGQLCDGPCQLKMIDERIYTGQGVKGEPHGLGVMWSNDGYVDQCGQWHRGVLKEQCEVSAKYMLAESLSGSHIGMMILICIYIYDIMMACVMSCLIITHACVCMYVYICASNRVFE